MKWPAYTNKTLVGVVDRCFVGLIKLVEVMLIQPTPAPKSLEALTGVFIIDTN
jgi:hypothetical protein